MWLIELHDVRSKSLNKADRIIPKQTNSEGRNNFESRHNQNRGRMANSEEMQAAITQVAI